MIDVLVADRSYSREKEVRWVPSKGDFDIDDGEMKLYEPGLELIPEVWLLSNGYQVEAVDD